MYGYSFRVLVLQGSSPTCVAVCDRRDDAKILTALQKEQDTLKLTMYEVIEDLLYDTQQTDEAAAASSSTMFQDGTEPGSAFRPEQPG